MAVSDIAHAPHILLQVCKKVHKGLRLWVGLLRPGRRDQVSSLIGESFRNQRSLPYILTSDVRIYPCWRAYLLFNN